MGETTSCCGTPARSGGASVPVSLRCYSDAASLASKSIEPFVQFSYPPIQVVNGRRDVAAGKHHTPSFIACSCCQRFFNEGAQFLKIVPLEAHAASLNSFAYNFLYNFPIVYSRSSWVIP